MKKNVISAREACYLTLVRCERDGSYSNIESNVQIKKHSLDGKERALFTALVRGVIERKITLDYHLASISSRPLEELDISLLIILRIGAYQLLYFDRIPAHAAVNESVVLAKKYAKGVTNSFVNAVLRELSRRKEAGTLSLPEDKTDALSVKYSVPTDLICMWREQYGKSQTQDILEALSMPHGITLHTNALKTSREALAENLSSLGIKSFLPEDVPEAICLESGTPFEDIAPLAEAGDFFVQDISSQKAAAMLDTRPGEVVIDTCVCPGGKSFALALAMQNTGEIHGFDLHKNKFSLVKDTQDKLGINILTLEERDARTPDPALIGKADRVLCDVPCSGLGIIAKKPEIRYRDVHTLERFSSLAFEILTSSKSYLKAGGHMLFSTCTLNKDENDAVLDRFLSQNADMHLIEKKTFFPTKHSDGFFAALIKRD